jgi:alpha-L-fucosidase
MGFCVKAYAIKVCGKIKHILVKCCDIKQKNLHLESSAKHFVSPVGLEWFIFVYKWWKMKTLTMPFTLLFFTSLAMLAQEEEPTFEKIYEREIPQWFNQDKFGIFVVWGPYSVPAYQNHGYAEWYWRHSQSQPDSRAFHERVYGKDFQYEQFAELFKADMFDPDFWCELFANSGAKYVVTTANYHDGFAMWPTSYSKTVNTDVWNSVVTGPKRDILGDLNTAGEKHGLKMGIYYSLYEWYHPLWINEKEKFVSDWFHPKFIEVVSQYKPWFIFLDGEWEQDYKAWRSEELAHWLYHESPVKNTVVVNDRWGQSRGIWGDVYESEYGGGKYTTPNHPWQEDRGIGHSYGYNRAETIYDYDSRDELIKTFSGVIGGGGNFLLCVGPTGDGRIPVIMQERLLQVGEWLEVNGEAVYGTTASPFWPRQFDWGTVSKKPGKLYLHVHNSQVSELVIKGISARIAEAKLLHKSGHIPVSYEYGNEQLKMKWPSHLNDPAVSIIELSVEEGYTVENTPVQFSNGDIAFNCWAMKVHGDKAYPHYDGYQNRLRMLNWTDPKEYLSADILIEKAGAFRLNLIYGATAGEPGNEFLQAVPGSAGNKYRVEIGAHTLEAEIQDTGSSNAPSRVEVGTVKIDKPGTYTFILKPVDDGNWTEFRFQGVEMKWMESPR